MGLPLIPGSFDLPARSASGSGARALEGLTRQRSCSLGFLSLGEGAEAAGLDETCKARRCCRTDNRGFVGLGSVGTEGPRVRRLQGRELQ